MKCVGKFLPAVVALFIIHIVTPDQNKS